MKIYPAKNAEVRRKKFKHFAVVALSISFAWTIPLTAFVLPPETNTTVQAFAYPEPNDEATASAIKDVLVGRTGFGTEAPRFSHAVRLYYVARQFKPVWSRADRLLPIAEDLRQTVGAIGEEGLDPDRPDYHRRMLDAWMDEGNETRPERLARMDLLLTDAFFALGRDLHFGVAYGADLNATHEYDNRPVDLAAALNYAASHGAVREILMDLAPHQPEYRRLREALAAYRRLDREGGWSTNAADYAFEDNVRRRLIATGDLIDFVAADRAVEEAKLREAVRHFQRRHGIADDGLVGPITAGKMAIAPEVLIEKIALNMERWKWLPPYEEGPRIIVNIPGYELEVKEADGSVLRMRAIVGRLERETPTFASKMRYIVYNPYWHVPETILKEDLIPKLRRNPHYLDAKRMKIFAAGDRNETRPIDPGTIKWKRWADNDIDRYVFREEPGPENPLGYIKFIFPNPYDVYIHDTPSHSLFKNSNGTFSSGCIRIRKPVELAYYLLSMDEPEITYREILLQILSGETRWVRLEHTPNVYVTYQTARVAENGQVYFYDDIYGYDAKLEDYLIEN